MVTAQRREQSIQDVPISINVFDGELLVQLKIDAVSDLVLQEPSLTLREGNGPNQVLFGMRGFSSLVEGAGVQPAVALAVDGVPLAMDTEFTMDMSDISRVEVLKGPQGTLFGGSAVGGLINLVRRQPTDVFEGSVELQLTDDEELSLTAMANGPLSDHVDGRLYAYSRKREGHIVNVFPGGKNIGGNDEQGFVAKLLFKPVDNVDLLLTGDFRELITYTAPVTIISDSAERTAAVGQEVIDDIFKINQNEESFGSVESWGVTAELNWEIDEGRLLTSITSYRDTINDTLFDIDASPAQANNRLNMDLVGLTMSNFNQEPSADGHTAHIAVSYFTHESRLTFSDKDYDWVIGGHYRDFSQRIPNDIALLIRGDFLASRSADTTFPAIVAGPNGQAPYYALAIVSDVELFRQELALYSDITWHVSNHFDVFAGLRLHNEEGELEHFDRRVLTIAEEPYFTSENNNGQFNIPLTDSVRNFTRDIEINEWAGRLGTSWFPKEALNVYATLSRGFIGIGADVAPQADSVQPFAFPTTALSAEFGLKSYLFDKRLMVNAAVFRQQNKDVQVAVRPPGEVGATAQARNAGDLVSQGLELTAALQATEALSLNASLTALDTERGGGQLEKCYFEQSPEQGCNIDRDGNGNPDHQDVSGSKSVGTPDLSYTVSARYERLVSNALRGYLLLNWNWRDEVQYTLEGDPLTIQRAFGLADAVLGIEDTQGRYEASLFAKNLFDTPFLSDRRYQFGRVSTVNTPRQARLFWGARFKVMF
ncbi:TonB-dependent receptor [Spongiibacter thalassae]|uniref:TonB-dependent receptor n=1 Tax=Spongiibacter thalassae TaxID=2721624 RepID=UPI001B2FF719